MIFSVLKKLISNAVFPMFMVSFVPSADAAFGFKLDGTLDKEAISHSYFEGEFSQVLLPLETYRESFPSYATKEDSIFVYKYLSVIYAADPSTRNKGESCMVQLLKMKPTIELIDLYISDNIASIFKDVKQKYLEQQKYIREHDLLGNSKRPDEIPTRNHHSSKWIWWTVGGVGTVAIATTVFFVIEKDGAGSQTSSDFKP
ncbi:MAG: hypothetical protein JWP91_1841 [Fibrobacteres bacterium]|nr:hypothetical protein [Fibrobacterota bacterium]